MSILTDSLLLWLTESAATAFLLLGSLIVGNIVPTVMHFHSRATARFSLAFISFSSFSAHKLTHNVGRRREFLVP